MKPVVTILLVCAIGFGALHYGRNLADSLDAFQSTRQDVDQHVSARDRLMAELDGTPSSAPEFDDVSFKASRPKEVRLPRFMSETGAVLSHGGVRPGPETGSVTLKDVNKAKCLELAEKWAGSIVINGRSHDAPATLCRANNRIEHSI